MKGDRLGTLIVVLAGTAIAICGLTLWWALMLIAGGLP